tara:strand:- start:13137 stop:13919 length:783 start_codon:yes stop_codon:yes gene_type:complete
MTSLFPRVPFNEFLIAVIGLYFIIVVRYFIIAGLFYWALWKRKTKHIKLATQDPSPKLVRSEINWSMLTSIIFAIPGAYMIVAWEHGGTLIYNDVDKYGILYLPVSAFLFMFIHDTYFYWTHRWMHKPKIFRVFHKVHHQSLNPTPWAAFSFHPTEGVVEAMIIPLLVFIIPVHIGVLLFALTAMTFFGVVNHCGFEIYPKSWMQGAFAKIMITPTHHSLHHKKFNSNYGLYFRFWDQWMGTDKWEPHPQFIANSKASSS